MFQQHRYLPAPPKDNFPSLARQLVADRMRVTECICRRHALVKLATRAIGQSLTQRVSRRHTQSVLISYVEEKRPVLIEHFGCTPMRGFGGQVIIDDRR